MNRKILTLSLLLTACATKEKVICPIVAEEAISVCRAKQNCLNANTSMGIGFGIGFPYPNSGTAVGMDVSRNQTDDTYTNCLDHDLDMQKAAADAGIKNTPKH